MATASTAEVNRPEATPAPRRTRKPRDTTKAVDLAEQMRETLRQEIREEEFAGLQDVLEETAKTIVQQAETLVQQGQLLAEATRVMGEQGQALNELRDLIKHFHDNGITVTTPEGNISINLTEGTASNGEAEVGERKLSGDEYIVNLAFMDFIEAYAALNKGFRDKRPYLSNSVQARYNDDAEPMLVIMQRGSYGTGDHMRDTILTMKIHDNEPYLAGEYMDFGKPIAMSDPQVKRCMDAIIVALRDEVDARTGAADPKPAVKK